MKPPLWHKEFPFLVQQALSYAIGGDVAEDALSKAKYHKRTFENGESIFLRQFAGRSLGDQIVVAFRPTDTLFDRRCALTVSIRGLLEDELNARLIQSLIMCGFTSGQTLENGSTLYANGKQDVEVYAFVKEECASIGICNA